MYSNLMENWLLVDFYTMKSAVRLYIKYYNVHSCWTTKSVIFFEKRNRRKKQKQKLVKQNLVKNFSVSRYSVKCEDHYCQVSSFRFFGNVFGYDKWKNSLGIFCHIPTSTLKLVKQNRPVNLHPLFLFWKHGWVCDPEKNQVQNMDLKKAGSLLFKKRSSRP